jgi:hypothetical protein
MMEAAGYAETFTSANLHGSISHNRVTFTLTAMRISELTLKPLNTLLVAEFSSAELEEPGYEAQQRRGNFSPLILKRPDRLCGAHGVSC